VVEDATDDGACRDEGDHPHHASTARAEERIDPVDPADELCPAPAQGGESGGRRRQGVGVRAWRGRLCLLGLGAGLLLAAHHVRVGAVVVDDVPAWVGDVGEHAGHEVEGVKGLGGLVVPGCELQGARPESPAQTAEADGADALRGYNAEGPSSHGHAGHGEQ